MLVNLVTPKQHLLTPVLFGRAYWKKLRNIDAANLIQYLPMNEATGTDALDKSAQGNNGAYTGVTLGEAGIGDGFTCPRFDGTNDYTDLYSASLNTDFDGQEGTLAFWMKVANAGVWTDGTVRYIARLYVDANNEIFVIRSATNNRLTFRYLAGGTSSSRNASDLTSTDFIHIAMRWSLTGDEADYFVNGESLIANNTLGTWAGNLHENYCLLGAQTKTPGAPFEGYIAHWALWKTPLSDKKIAEVAAL